MFEKMKQKAKDAKKWAVEHKVELAYLVGGVIGAISTALAYMYLDDKQQKDTLKRYPGTCGVLSMRKHADDMMAYYGNTGDVTIESLSGDLAAHEMSKDDIVIGALVFTKKK